jgi:hypothetical protein
VNSNKQNNDDKFVSYIKECFLLANSEYIIDDLLVKPTEINSELFYVQCCQRACLRPDGALVQQAFKQILKPQMLNVKAILATDGSGKYRVLNDVTVKSGDTIIIQMEGE